MQFCAGAEGIRWCSATMPGQHLVLAVIFFKYRLSLTFPLEFSLLSANSKSSSGLEFLRFLNNLFSSSKGILFGKKVKIF
jgi:hypothetical protein